MHTIKELQEKVTELFDNRNYIANPKELYEPIQYSLSQGGKRLRPLLSLLSCSLFGGNLEDVYNSSIGLEIFHNFTLLHDDIMDKSPLRRGMPSVYQKWDANTAILSGDTMFVLAYEYVAKTNPEILVDTINAFNQTAREVCEGQQYDMNFENETHTSIDDYMEMIRLKTAVLIAAALKIGAIAAKASKEQIDKIYDFGILIGLAFQLRDDYLDAFGDQSVFGKPIGNDILTNKKTYLYIKAFELAKDENLESLKKAFAIENPEDKVEAVLKMYDRLSIKKITQSKIEQLYADSLEILNQLDRQDSDKKEVYSFLQQLIKREV
jgi:geranylgeranyl diphosphate synthase type II